MLGCRDKLSAPDGMSTLFFRCGQCETRAADEKHVFSSGRQATIPGSFLWSFRWFAMFMQISVDRTVSQNATQKPITNNRMHQQCKFGSVSDFFFFLFVLSDLSIQLCSETIARIHNSVSLLQFQNKINRVDIENDANRTSSI